jgi:heat shock protein HtpX
MTTALASPLLACDRVARNRRRTSLLVVAAVLALVPFVVAAGFGLAEAVLPAFRAEIAHYNDFRFKLTLVFAGGVSALLGILFWGLASSPTSRLLTMLGARPAGSESAEAARLVEKLSAAAGLPVPRLYVVDTSLPNAFSAGMDPEHAVVGVTVGLLTLLDSSELETVLAHELSHIGNRDTRLNTAVAAITLFLRLPYLLRHRGRMARRMEPRTRRTSGSAFRYYSVALIPAYLYVILLAPLLATLVRAAISRQREFLADADAALLTGRPDALVRALAKIGGAGTRYPDANAAIAHLWFADPVEKSAVTGLLVGKLLSTHPPVSERVKRLMEANSLTAVAEFEQAVRAGKFYTETHSIVRSATLPDSAAGDELSVLTGGNPMGIVYRLAGASPAALYNRDDPKSAVLARVKPGDLLIVFDDPGGMRQVMTEDQTFGYLPRRAKLERLDLLPSEVHDPARRAAAASAAAEAAQKALTPAQTHTVLIFGAAVFGAVFLALLWISGR